MSSTTAAITTNSCSWDWVPIEAIPIDRIESNPTAARPTQWGQNPYVRDVTPTDMFDWVRHNDDYQLVVNTLKKDGWHQPSPELFIHWYHSEYNARIIKALADRERETSDALFKRMKENGIDKTLDDFIGQKMWYPNCPAKAPAPVLPNVVSSPRTPPNRRYKTTPNIPRKSKSPKCHKCHKIGHIRRACPTRQA